MNITIWDVEIIDEATRCILQHIYFFTRKSAEQYGQRHTKEWRQNSWVWTMGGEPLYFGKVRD